MHFVTWVTLIHSIDDKCLKSKLKSNSNYQTIVHSSSHATSYVLIALTGHINASTQAHTHTMVVICSRCAFNIRIITPKMSI